MDVGNVEENVGVGSFDGAERAPENDEDPDWDPMDFVDPTMIKVEPVDIQTEEMQNNWDVEVNFPFVSTKDSKKKKKRKKKKKSSRKALYYPRMEPTEEPREEKYSVLKKRFNLKEFTIRVVRLTPGQIDAPRRETAIERVAGTREGTPKCRAKSKGRKSVIAEGLKCPVGGCKSKKRFDIKELEVHQRRYHEGVKKPFSCNSCTKAFLTERMLEDHLNVHKGLKPYLCSDCGSQFSSKDMFDRHRRNAHSDGKRIHTFTCKRCFEKFESRKAWQIHSIIHLPPEEQVEAYRIEGERVQVNGKRKRKPGPKKLSCDLCDFKARYPSHLQEHVLVHTGIKPYCCHLCGDGFKRSTALKQHMAVHSEERPCLCPHCGKTFKLKKTLKTHLFLHESKYCYRCPLCPKQYPTRALLTQHMHSHRKRGQVVPPDYHLLALVPHTADLSSDVIDTGFNSQGSND